MSLFVTFEGPEGGGKTTQMALLADYLRGQGCDVLATREPGGTRIGDRIRAILLDPAQTDMLAPTEFLLFSAQRAQHVRQVIEPHLRRGGVVLCDRYADASLAYQGYGHRQDLEVLRVITRFATGGLMPDLTFCLDVPVAVGLRRKVGGSGDAWNRIEDQGLAYHERVRAGYHEMAARDPARWLIVDGARPAEAVQQTLREAVLARWRVPTDVRGGGCDETRDGHRQ